MSTEQPLTPAHTIQNFPVVGVGASAGGLKAFQRFLETIPHNSGMAFVFVQHLAPSHESVLTEILAKYTDLPVYEIVDEINLAPNNIYILPANKMLKATDGKLILTARDLTNNKNMPIDLFFNSLAEVHRSFSIGVVLSGAGFDGSRGLQAIKEMGGVTYAQNPETATFDSMPNNAINTGSVDFILPPEDIPPHLLHVNEAYRTNHAYADDLLLSPDEDDVFKHILRIVRLRSGNDFTNYKQPTIRRRIARRMVVNKMEDPSTYVKFLRHNLDEQDALFNDILIPVTNFFRDAKTFEVLGEAVFPLLLKNKKPDESIRIWSAGCSTGEEAYSLAICLHEFLAEKAPGMKVQIFASDISEAVIVKARA
ncbi:MAG TPA: chemotaxis protein CheB, partial [Flavobacterium sp.]|nr:chemotaxis protein CheB [Flavobacterium sp.]